MVLLPSALTSLILLIASSSLPAAMAAGALVNDTSCDCFLTNDTNTFYKQHRFYDFRSLSRYQGVPDVIATQNETAWANATSDYFASHNGWRSAWQIVNWNNSAKLEAGTASVLMVNSLNNVYIQENDDDGSPESDTYLAMRTARLEGFQSAAEIDTVQAAYQYLSIRMRARATGSPGAVAAMFTYREPRAAGEAVQEADLEIRTRDPRNSLQCTNQPSTTTTTGGGGGEVLAQATANATMPRGLDWTAWAVHRLDWTPRGSTWYVDGERVAAIAFQTPRDPSSVVLNVWSDGGAWSGNMTLHDEAFLHVQWIEMVFNSTEAVGGWTDSSAPGRLARRGGGGCRTVCSIDDTDRTGVAAELWSAAPGSRPSLGLAGLVSGVALVALLVSSSSVVF